MKVSKAENTYQSICWQLQPNNRRFLHKGPPHRVALQNLIRFDLREKGQPFSLFLCLPHENVTQMSSPDAIKWRPQGDGHVYTNEKIVVKARVDR
jgi:hypothetical protein